MKTFKILYILAFINLIQANLNAQWINIFQDNNVTFHAIDCLSDDTVFVAGTQSTVLRTYDKGQTWQAINPIFEIDAVDINFPDELTGYIVGYNGKIAKTTNCGNNWELMVTDTSYTLIEALFINADSGWIIGSHLLETKGIVLKTINGGKDWNYYYSEDELFNIEMINNLTGLIGIYGGNYGFLKTEDGGDTWNLSNPEFQWINTVSFINENIGYCTASQGGLHRTTNGGTTWEFITNDYGIGFYSRSQLLFLTEEIGYYLGWEKLFNGGKIMRSDDSGNTWQDQIGGKFWDMEMINTDTGYAITWDGRIYKTINGGLPVGIAETNIAQSNLAVILPNPLTESFLLKIDPVLIAIYRQLNFLIYDLNGKNVKKIENIKASETKIKMGNLPPGIYLYSLTNGSKIIESNKLIIK